MSELNSSLLLLVGPEDLSEYLRVSGWSISGAVGTLANIWNRQSDEQGAFEILQPKSRRPADYVQRVAGAIRVVARFEERPAAHTLEDILSLHADVLKIRVVHPDVGNGTIPLGDGATLVSSVRDFVAAGVLSTFSKRGYFTGKPPESIASYLESVHLGQTERGSFVVNLLAPLEQISNDLDPDAQLGRLVMRNISKSLEALNVARTEYSLRRDPTVFHATIDQGVSANLCDSLVEMTGKQKARNVEIVIQPSKLTESSTDFRKHHTISPQDVAALRVASEYFKGSFALPEYTVSGEVVDMHHEDEDFGKIRVRTDIRGVPRKVTLTLGLKEYWEAVEAHRANQFIECTGSLHVTSRSAILGEVFPGTFKVVGNKDIED